MKPATHCGAPQFLIAFNLNIPLDFFKSFIGENKWNAK